MKLVVVESPNKVKKISGFLGANYRVAASFGHVADLPASGGLAVSFQNGQVIPHYEALERSAAHIRQLRQYAKQAEAVLLATDPDREGEAIAWHVQQLIGKHTYERVVFHAITQKAVQAAVANPRQLNQSLVDAQQARRVLDRVVGWVVSPTLRKGLGDKEARSAGRVQSAALRLVVERELEIQAHANKDYFTLDAVCLHEPTPPPFTVRLLQWKGEDLGHRLASAELAEKTADWCKRQAWRIHRRDDREQIRKPPPPFTTATVQQAASVKLKRNPDQTMKQLQQLFENGHITYHRTDSVALDPEAIKAARAIISQRFPAEYLPAKAIVHQAKTANAQEAHEAIRPTHPKTGPEAVEQPGLKELYRLIWERFIACQMAPAKERIGVLDVACAPDAWTSDAGKIPMGIFRARGRTVLFDGWRRLGDDATSEHKKTTGKNKKDSDESEVSGDLPDLAVGTTVQLQDLSVIKRTTKAPARYTQASLIKKLEAEGIGRPSTYASILATIMGRHYVLEKKRKLHASDLGIRVVGWLKNHFAGNFIDLAYTVRMESTLDEIGNGTQAWEQVVTEAAFAVRDAATGAGLWYDPLAEGAAGRPEPAAINTPCPLCGSSMEPRSGVWGPYYACSSRKCPAILRMDGKPNRKTAELLAKKNKGKGN